MSASTTSMPRARAAAIASNITAAGSPPSCAITATRLRSPQTASCSRAAARKVSPAASSTDRPWPWKCLASLPIDVVLPAPLTPASMITNGRAAVTTSGFSSGASKVAERRLQHRLGIALAAGGLPARGAGRRAGARSPGTPTSAVISAVSSSSSVSSSSVRRLNTPTSAPASFSRDLDSPERSRRSRSFLLRAPGRRRVRPGSRPPSPCRPASGGVGRRRVCA